jgi:preprotein translocase subunit YajC
MFVTPAFAQDGGAAAPGFDLVSLLPLILIFVVFYFLLIRPQQKRMKQHKQMVEALRRGDRVVTAGGLIGTVTKVINERELQVEIAEGVRTRVVRQTISEVLSKTEPAQAASEEADDEQEESEEEAEKPKSGRGNRKG